MEILLKESMCALRASPANRHGLRIAPSPDFLSQIVAKAIAHLALYTVRHSKKFNALSFGLQKPDVYSLRGLA